MLELAILGLLKRRPMHGYDLRKRLRDDFGPMANLSFGSLYPALARLEASGAVRALAPTAPRARQAEPVELSPLAMTGSLTGERAALMARRATAKAAAALSSRGTRSRKVYEITTEGELLFERLLDSPDARGEEARSFVLRLAFAQHLTPQARIRLLERRRMQLADRLQVTRRSLDTAGSGVDRYEYAIAEHAHETVERDLQWIERLLGDERADLDREPRGTHPVVEPGVALAAHDLPAVPAAHDLPAVPAAHDLPAVPAAHDLPVAPAAHDLLAAQDPPAVSAGASPVSTSRGSTGRAPSRTAGGRIRP